MNNLTEFPVENMIRLAARYLKTTLKRNELYEDTKVTPFHSSAVPDISIESYIRRIQKSIRFKNNCLLVTLIYMDRMAQSTQHFYANSYTIHRLLLTSITVANKFLSDECSPNSLYAKVGGLPVYELNNLELELLFQLNFELNIQSKELLDYTQRLMRLGVEDLSKGISCTCARRHGLSETMCTCSVRRNRRSSPAASLDASSELDRLVLQVDRTVLSRETLYTDKEDSATLKLAKDRLRTFISSRKSPHTNLTRVSICPGTLDHLNYYVRPTHTRPASYHPSSINGASVVSVPM